jgi:hypothetical protein
MTMVIDPTAGITFPDSTQQVSGSYVLQHLEATPYTAATSSNSLYAGGDAAYTTSTGQAVCSVTITPKYANSIISVRGQIVASTALNGTVSASLHVGSANAFAAARNDPPGADYICTLPVQASFVAGGTSAITISLRGHATSSSIVFNGVGAGRRGGGAFASTLVVQEIKQ